MSKFLVLFRNVKLDTLHPLYHFNYKGKNLAAPS